MTVLSMLWVRVWGIVVERGWSQPGTRSGCELLVHYIQCSVLASSHDQTVLELIYSQRHIPVTIIRNLQISGSFDCMEV